MNITKGDLTTFIVWILAPVFAYFAVDSATQSILVSMIVALVMIGLKYYDEKYPSSAVSGEVKIVDSDVAE